MDQKITINASEYAIGFAPQVLATDGVGSCVAICLYNANKKAGALLHIMLPTSTGDGLNPLRFADTALRYILDKLEAIKLSKSDFCAKLVGGAHMFKSAGPMMDLGKENLYHVGRILQENNIKIVASDVGGHIGRSLEFDLNTGLVKITTLKVE